MPKVKVEEKIIDVDIEDKEVDIETPIGEGEEDTEEETILDDEEINPFGDKWEE